jgi:hypothetical protein
MFASHQPPRRILSNLGDLRGQVALVPPEPLRVSAAGRIKPPSLFGQVRQPRGQPAAYASAGRFVPIHGAAQ